MGRDSQRQRWTCLFASLVWLSTCGCQQRGPLFPQLCQPVTFCFHSFVNLQLSFPQLCQPAAFCSHSFVNLQLSVPTALLNLRPRCSYSIVSLRSYSFVNLRPHCSYSFVSLRPYCSYSFVNLRPHCSYSFVKLQLSVPTALSTCSFLFPQLCQPAAFCSYNFVNLRPHCSYSFVSLQPTLFLQLCQAGHRHCPLASIPLFVT